MQAGRVARSVVAIAVALFLVRVLGEPWTGGFDPFFPDTASYVRVADRGPFWPRFWFDERPPLYPLVLWFFGSGGRAVVVVQVAAYALAWVWLASVVWRRITSRPVAVAVIGVMSLTAIQARWALWTTHLLTESLSITLAVAGVAAWWQFVAEPRRWRIVVATSITASWMLLRDSNSLTFLAFAVPALVLATLLARRTPTELRRYSAAGLAVLVATGVYSSIGQLAADRGETSFHNNVGLRWLPDAGMTSFFESRGMPVDEALVGRTGADSWADGEAFLRDPALAEYRKWADGRGRMAAAESFVLEVPFWLDGLRGDLGRFLDDDFTAYDLFGVGERLPRRTLGPFDPVGSPTMMAVGAVASTAAALVAARRRRALALLCGFVLVPAWIDLYLSYAGDAVEVGRHLIGPLSRLSVGMVVVIGIGIDALLDARHDRWRHARPGVETGDSLEWAEG
ncbi:MAG: hypothetical protein ACRDZZ_08220 [Ilumatobacteraceae bacterium]